MCHRAAEEWEKLEAGLRTEIEGVSQRAKVPPSSVKAASLASAD